MLGSNSDVCLCAAFFDSANFGEGYLEPEMVEELRTSADKRSILDEEVSARCQRPFRN